MREYYERRAAEYDETILTGADAATAAAFHRELDGLGRVLAALPPARVLDVACGTALFTRYLRGEVVALDQSEGMLRITRTRVPAARLVRAAVPPLPFADRAFERLCTAHFYGHLVETERLAFLAEARRVASEVLVVDEAVHPGAQPDGWQPRTLRDGSRYTIYKRHFSPERLAAELGGDGEVLFAGRFFVAVRSRPAAGGVAAGRASFGHTVGAGV